MEKVRGWKKKGGRGKRREAKGRGGGKAQVRKEGAGEKRRAGEKIMGMGRQGTGEEEMGGEQRRSLGE